jgi:cytochrome bd ubiquinol oxidase subunit I
MDTLLAARWQMAMSLAFHMVFAAIGIGLPLLLVLVERQYLRTGQEYYKALAKKWAKATGLLFAVGAVSGTALSFELGLLWPRYMELTGAVVGHIFGLEGYAFFVEAIFIGLYLYGWDRISPRAHWWCGVMIAISGALSGIFILGVNAWMQVPVGFTIEAGRVAVSDPIAIFKHPAWVHMAIHSTLSCYAAVGFAVAGIYAWGWLKGRRDAYHRSAILTAMAVGGIAALLQPISGDLLAKFVYQTQPHKFAAMEAQFETQSRAPLRIGGWPDVERGVTNYAINIPGGLSFLATGDFSAEVRGLDQIPREDWPNIAITHAAFQIMVGLGLAMAALTIWFWIAWWRNRDDFIGRRLGWALVLAAPIGYIALQAGWVVSEVGRQPWVIVGIMRTSEAVTPRGEVPMVFYSFAILYLVLAAAVIFLLYQLAQPESRELAAPQSVKYPTDDSDDQ